MAMGMCLECLELQPQPWPLHGSVLCMGRNTPANKQVRIERHARMREKVQELGLSAVVQATDEFDPAVRT